MHEKLVHEKLVHEKLVHEKLVHDVHLCHYDRKEKQGEGDGGREEEVKKGEIGGGERWEGSKEVSLRNTLCRVTEKSPRDYQSLLSWTETK